MSKQVSARAARRAVAAVAEPERRYLALWFPFLSSDRARRAPGDAGPTDVPLVLVAREGGTIRVSAVDSRAQAHGVAPGMPVAAAQALVPDLAIHDIAPEADQDWIERIADLCERYTPMVALDESDGITLDLTECAETFGGEDALLTDLETRLGNWSDDVRHALAGSPAAAQALARFRTMPAANAAAALRRLDVAALRLPADTLATLRDAKVKTIGDLAACPAAAIAEHFGEDTAEAVERLLGTDDAGLDPRRRLPALTFERGFAAPITRIRPLRAAITALAAEATAVLEARHQGGRRFCVRLFHSDGTVRTLGIKTALPVRDPALLVRLFRERIAALAEPLDLRTGCDLIRFALPRVEPLAPTQLRLEGGVADAPGERTRIRRSAANDGALPEQGVLGL